MSTKILFMAGLSQTLQHALVTEDTATPIVTEDTGQIVVTEDAP